METTFISIHDLSLDARLLYASDSIADVLGYEPAEVVGKSCYEYFHPDEIPFARSTHERGVKLDKAAVLAYCRIRSKEGQWIGCECAFTVVYNVLVACTSIYRRSPASQNRAVEAPAIRRLFASSPRDPRYHMLSHLSAKFRNAPNEGFHEPRAALILNRFTRTLTILYATTALESIIGLPPETVVGKSFYECIQEGFLQDAVQCLERAKANDSIAYMRFWYRDPLQDNQQEENASEQLSSGDDDDDDGGVHLDARIDETTQEQSVGGGASLGLGFPSANERSLSGDSTDFGSSTNTSPLFGHASSTQSSSSGEQQRPVQGPGRQPQPQPIEVEAVVSCTSDGLVVILRRARPVIPQPHTIPQTYARGLFASPWAAQPLLPAQPPPQPVAYGASATPNLIGAGQGYLQPIPAGSGGPDIGSLMDCIRQVAVFAWSLTGINGSLVQYARGKAAGQSQPPDGFPVWTPSCSTNGGTTNDSAEARYGNGPSVPFWAGTHGSSFKGSSSHGLWPNHPEEGRFLLDQSRAGENETDNWLRIGGRDTADDEDSRWGWSSPDPNHTKGADSRRHRWH
ncbi:hypothetical protein GP486_008162 [Trichoglossum hirsutum]|uniref:PAS domain-containing protein n=1 Tax=Trichoglossum hirsutum TaxID=265104 RepID=A0A9P8IHE0_9PEZI|nr:hypothetical protein GP486_008162 [Trichoglossum hirsutum]